MQTVVNEDKVERGARIGKIGTFAGLGFLLAGLIISLLNPMSSLVWVSFACLIVGLVVSSIGTANMNRWVKEPRADQALTQGLKGFDDRYRMYHYVLPAPHVLLSPAGLYVLTAMGHDGVIRYDGTKFHRNFSLARAVRFMAEEGLGKPFAELNAQVAALRKFLKENNAGQDVEIEALLVFYSPKAELILDDPAAPVTTSKGLKKQVRKQRGTELKGKQYDELLALFEAAAAAQ
ncbi:MAG: NERD domain-containing protein [Anaerolineae bacterium]|nr:NERD domain-containing protein [Anaerolineae bacterium]